MILLHTSDWHIGMPVGNSNYREDQLFFVDELVRVIREEQADAVLYHWKNSLHKDHEAAHRITESAIFYASLPTFERPLPPAPVKRFMCAENWEDEPEFSPYYWFDVTEAFRYYEALSIMRGARIGVDHASCFGASPTAKRQKLDLL